MNRDRLLPLLALIVIQAILLTDVLIHDPNVGYDAHEHQRYVRTLAKFELPGPEQSGEYFTPPLPYVIPALAYATGLMPHWWVAKVAQFVNLIYSIGLCLLVLQICKLLSPDSALLQFWSLALLAIIPVYYKTFSMMRGEPLLTLLIVAGVYTTLRAYLATSRRWRDFVALGVLLGLAILSRQLAFFIFPGLAGFGLLLPAENFKGRMLNLKPLLISFAIAIVVGGWFYLSLHNRFGDVTAFNRPFNPWSPTKRPAQFYVGLGLDSLFSDPIRPAFRGELIPSFYSEFWGDYECYFLVYGKEPENGRFHSGADLARRLERDPTGGGLETNRFTIGRWLGLSQAFALVPSALFAVGLAMGTGAIFRARDDGDRGAGLLAMVTLGSMLGYLWFLLSFQNPGSGNAFKATYLLQIVPFLAILGARFLISIRTRSLMAYRVLTGLLALSAAMNLPFLFTRYVVFPW